jgi:hypothetical protein
MFKDSAKALHLANSVDEVLNNDLVQIWRLFIMTTWRLGARLRRWRNASWLIERRVHIGGPVTVNMWADEDDPGILVGERHYDAIRPSQVLDAQTG